MYSCRTVSKMKSLLLHPCSCISLDSAIQWSYFYRSQIGAIEISQKCVKTFFLNASLRTCLVIFQTALPHSTVQTELRYGPDPATLTCSYNPSDCHCIETNELLIIIIFKKHINIISTCEKYRIFYIIFVLNSIHAYQYQDLNPYIWLYFILKIFCVFYISIILIFNLL